MFAPVSAAPTRGPRSSLVRPAPPTAASMHPNHIRGPLDAPMRTQLPWFTAGNVTASAAITGASCCNTPAPCPTAATTAPSAQTPLSKSGAGSVSGPAHRRRGYFNPNYAVSRCSSKLSARRHQRRLELPSRTPPRCSPCLPQGRPHHRPVTTSRCVVFGSSSDTTTHRTS